MWFVAEGLFRATVHAEKADVRLITENLLFLVRAADQAAAVMRAEVIAQGKEHSYRNEQGELIDWTFVRLVEVTEMIDQRFEEGAELKSIMTNLNSPARDV